MTLADRAARIRCMCRDFTGDAEELEREIVRELMAAGTEVLYDALDCIAAEAQCCGCSDRIRARLCPPGAERPA